MSPLRRGVQLTVTVDEVEAWKRSHGQLERTAGMLRAYQRQGITMISIEDVLDLLGQDPAAPQDTRKAVPRDPREDPLTGAMWAGPPGTSPPSR